MSSLEEIKAKITEAAKDLAEASGDNIEITVVMSRRGPSAFSLDDLVAVAVAHSHPGTPAYEIGSALEEAVGILDKEDAIAAVFTGA